MNLLVQRYWRMSKSRQIHEDHALLLEEFASLNRVKPGAEFDLEALRRGSLRALSWHTIDWPGCDHPSFLKRDKRAAMIVSEPYDLYMVEKTRAEAERLGLTLHMPPNPQASLYWPSWTYFVVLTRPDFGEVRWLPEQTKFPRSWSFPGTPPERYRDPALAGTKPSLSWMR